MSFGSSKRLRALAAQKQMMLRIPNSSFIAYTEETVSSLSHFHEPLQTQKPWKVFSVEFFAELRAFKYPKCIPPNTFCLSASCVQGWWCAQRLIMQAQADALMRAQEYYGENVDYFVLLLDSDTVTNVYRLYKELMQILNLGK